MATIAPAVAAGLTIAAGTATSTPARIEVGPDCTIQTATQAEAPASGVRTQRVLCGDVRMDMSSEAFSPRSTAGPVMAERRRLVLRALTEGLSENWLDAGDGIASAWRIMSSSDPAYMTAVSIWIDGKPIRPGLKMRLRMALASLTGSGYAPMLVTVTPVVDGQTRNIAEIKAAEASLPQFLLTHPDLDRTIGALSALP